VNYSMNYRDESLRQNGMITASEFESAVASGSREQYEALGRDMEEARTEFEQFEQVANEQFGPAALSFVNSKQAFDDCRVAISSILRKKQTKPNGVVSLGGIGTAQSFAVGSSASNGSLLSDSWADAERMARAGEVDRALSTMAALAAAEPNGRVRFQRKLLLADICI